MKSNKLRLLIVLMIGALIVGCSSRGVMREANDATDKAQSKMHKVKAADATTAPAVIEKHNYYYDTKPIASDDRATWLHNTINVSAKKVPLSFVMSRILRSTDVLVKYQPGVHKDRLVSIDYSGTVKGALEQLASQTNYAYETTEQDITWEAYVTKTFDISFMPGAATYVVGQTTANTSNNNSSGSSSGSNTNTTTGNLMSNDQEYSGMQAASLSVWNDLKQTLAELKSPEGKVAVSEATTMVTVYDHPANVTSIARYINELNKAMTQEVRLKVQVLEVDLDKEHVFGLDWNLVQRWLGTNVSIAGGLGSAANVASSAGGSAASSVFSPLALTAAGDRNNSNVVLQALSTQGKVSVVTEPTVVTMNNQVAEIRISRNTSYLQNVSVTNGTGSNNNTTTALTPGVVTDGYILYLLPKIKDARVFLQVSSTLSNLTSLNTVNSSGTVSQNGSADNKGNPVNAIQIPTLAEKRFNIRGLVANNATLIIGGFKQTHNSTRENKFLEVKALGGQGAQVQNSETVILITPTIVEN